MAQPVTMIAGFYPNDLDARHQLRTLRSEDINLVDVLVLRKDSQGETYIEEIDVPDTDDGSTVGAIIGGLLGLATTGGAIGGVLGGTALGAATGGLTDGITAALMDTDVDTKQLDELLNNLEPDSSALIVIAPQPHADLVQETISAHDSEVVSYDLDLDLIQAEPDSTTEEDNTER